MPAKNSAARGKKMKKTILFIGLIAAFFVLASCSQTSYPRDEVDSFAKCLTENGVVEYGAFWCPNCAKQKKMFGSSYQYINYVECDARGENPQPELCLAKNVNKYPDWEFADGSRLEGVQPFEVLAQKSGCTAPTPTA